MSGLDVDAEKRAAADVTPGSSDAAKTPQLLPWSTCREAKRRRTSSKAECAGCVCMFEPDEDPECG